MSELHPARTAASTRRRILVVDDDEATARLLKRFLHRYDVEIAHDGGEGLALAVSFRPELVITDYWMPGVDGAEMTQALHDDPVLRSVPVIFVTAALDAPHVAAAISAGARHWLPKPLDVERLLRTVEKLLA